MGIYVNKQLVLTLFLCIYVTKLPFTLRKPYRRLWRNGLKPGSIDEKVNLILNVILVVVLLILFRIWHVSIVQYDDFLDKARRPQLREVIAPAERGTITDCFGEVLASNKIQYNAAVYYNQFKQVPRVKFVKDEKGGKQKLYPRKEYISKLSYLLAEELEMDARRIEDLIYSKAAIFPQLPFILKENISEQTYYRLKFLERSYLGLCAEKTAKRFYPKGKVASSIIGHLGPISSTEYHQFYQRLKKFENCLSQEEHSAYLSLPKGVNDLPEATKIYEELKEKAYKINDLVGKSGVEAHFNSELRGFRGQRTYISDAKGNYLRELPLSREAFPGKRIQLTISYELQKLAEELLVKSEGLRNGSSKGIDVNTKVYSRFKQPFIKGGAIVAMDPKNGNILALASYPRLDSNLLIPQVADTRSEDHEKEVMKFLENDRYIGGIWDEKWPLEKEIYDPQKKNFKLVQETLTFSRFLRDSLPVGSVIIEPLESMTAREAVALQRSFFTLLTVSQEQDIACFINNLFPVKDSHRVYERMVRKHSTESLMEIINRDSLLKQCLQHIEHCFRHIPDNYDKLLLVDLSRLIIDEGAYTEEVLDTLGEKSLSDLKHIYASCYKFEQGIYSKVKNEFDRVHFQIWRENHQKEFLKQKRLEEKQAGTYAKPYIDYLDVELDRQFKEFWQNERKFFIFSFFNPHERLGKAQQLAYKPLMEQLDNYLKEISLEVSIKGDYDELKELIQGKHQEVVGNILDSMQSFSSLETPLLGRYFGLRASPGEQNLQHLAMAFYPTYGYGFSKSLAYQDTAVQGSIFKVIPSYAALSKTYFDGVDRHPHMIRQLNPFDIVDSWHVERKNGKKKMVVGYFSNGKEIPRLYKKGRMPKSQRRNIGKIDLIRAIETSSNPYFALIAGDVLEDDEDLLNYSKLFGFGEKTGLDLPYEHRGYLPRDLKNNKNGVYSMSIGQHSFEVTPIQTAVMLSSLANGGAVLKPRIVKKSFGNHIDLDHKKLFSQQEYAFKDFYDLLGLDFPLLTNTESHYEASEEELSAVTVRKWVPMPSSIQSVLTEGMRRVVNGESGCARKEAIRTYRQHPDIMHSYDKIRPYLAGKTSTSEAVERMDTSRKCNIYNHIWFGGVAYDKKIPALDNLIRDGKPFVFHDKYGDPELCVVVYLKFGDYGREATPLATEIISKWREINSAHKQ